MPTSKVRYAECSEIAREVGVHHFRVAAKQQLFHLDHRLLGVSSRTVGVEFRWKAGFSTSIAAVMQTRSRKVEMPSGLSLPLAFGMNTLLMPRVRMSRVVTAVL